MGKSVHANEIGLTSFKLKSPAMQKLYSEIADYAFHGRPCILFGLRGAGKEFVANYYAEKFRESRSEKSKIPFVTLSCAGLSETLAQSELFGYVKGAFTGASSDKKGLFSAAEGGVLFLDEVGDLTPRVQAELLRAISPGEARKVGDTKTYSTKGVTVICATEKPKDTFRPSLLDRFGAQVFVPGLDARPEDIPCAIEFFSRRALVKRRDVREILQQFYSITTDDDSENLMQKPEILDLANEIRKRLEGLVRQRSWPGNLRALRVAVDTAVIRARISAGQEAFLNDVVIFFVKHRDNYSMPLASSTTAEVAMSRVALVEAEAQEAVERKLIEALCNALPGIDARERVCLATFLSKTKGHIFTRKDVEAEFPSLSPRTIQDRLRKLRLAKVVSQHGKRGEQYRLTVGLTVPISEKPEKSVFLPLPPDINWPDGVRKDLDAIQDLLEHSRAVFIGGERGVGKTACAQALGMELSKERPVYYYSFGDQGLPLFLEILDKEMQERNITNASILNPDDLNNPALQVAVLSGYVRALFNAEDKPVLILDNVQLLTDPEQEKALLVMVQYWKHLTFVLVGQKLGNEFQKDVKDRVVEYNIVRPVNASDSKSLVEEVEEEEIC